MNNDLVSQIHRVDKMLALSMAETKRLRDALRGVEFWLDRHRLGMARETIQNALRTEPPQSGR